MALTALLALMPQGAASVGGIVVKMGSGEPIAGARVELHPERDIPAAERRPEVRPEVYTVTTSRDGKFLFDKVEPAAYRLFATRNDYIPGEFGQRTSTMQGIPLEIAAGQKRQGIQLAMTPAGSISGRIYDRDGEPVGKAQVLALRPIYRDGRRTLTIVQTVQTNDRGEYRLFWLPPGRYYVSAKPDIPELPSVSGNSTTIPVSRVTEPARFGTYSQASNPVIRKRTLKTGEVIEETYLPVYYPSVVEAQAASPVELGAGASVSGVNISVGPGLVPVRHIRGRIINNADARPPDRVSIMAIPRTNEPLLAIPVGQPDPNGVFDLAGATAGPYLVAASAPGGSTGMVQVDVANADIQSLALVMTRQFTVRGKFTVEGRTPDGREGRVADLRVSQLTRDPNLMGMPGGGPSYNPPVEPDGSFILEGVSPGDYRVAIRTGSDDAYIKSMRVGNMDVLEGDLHLTGPPENLLEIVVNVNGGRINGSVVNARGEPLSNRTVVLMPDLRLRHRNDLYKTVSTDASGRFRMQGLTPGSYQLFAWEDVETGAWQDPDFIRVYESRAKSIQVSEGSDENIQLTVIP